MLFGSASTIRLGRVFGFPVGIHISLLLVLGLLALLGGSSFGVAGLVLAVMLFGSVLAHEIGHSLVARRLGVPISGITLYPFGGVAKMLRMPKGPRDEILISAAGPLVSLAMALGFLLLSRLGMDGSPLRAGAGYLAELNLILGLFNLAPALPMDGGRIFRAILAMKHGYQRATMKAARVARWVGWGFVALALLVGNPWLVLVAIVVLFLSRQEAAMARNGTIPGYDDAPRAYRMRTGPTDASGARVVELPADKKYTIIRRPDGSILIQVDSIG